MNVSSIRIPNVMPAVAAVIAIVTVLFAWLLTNGGVLIVGLTIAALLFKCRAGVTITPRRARGRRRS